MAKQIDDPHRQLICAIIMQAVNDWKLNKYHAYYREELIEFFNGEWFELLSDAVDLNPDATRKALKIPKCAL